jgi:hypothetical protein
MNLVFIARLLLRHYPSLELRLVLQILQMLQVL